MNFDEMMKQQWNSYGKFHKSRLNLLIHMVAVPFCLIGVVNFAGSMVRLSIGGMISSAIIAALAFGAQLFGHTQEEFSDEPMTDVKESATRILLEQCVTFPKYVLTGQWYTAFKSSH